MIPLIPIGNFFLVILCSWIVYKTYRSWKKTKDQNFEWFYKVFIFLALTLSLYILPPFVKNLYIIGVLFCLVDSLIFILVAYFLLIILNFLGQGRFQKILFRTLITSGIIVFIIGMIFYKPASIFYSQFLDFSFVGWERLLPPQIRALFVISLGILAFISLSTLLLKSLKIEDPYFKRRGLTLTTSVFFIFLAGINHFALVGSFLKDIFHLIFISLAIVFMFLTIYYKKPKTL